MLSGGGGLISTAADYERFTRMLLQGGELDGVRLLGTRTLAYMGRNHLPGGGLLSTLGRGQFAETAYDGIGFGLGFGVLADPLALKVHASPGEMTWGGLASTAFWVDPLEGITAHFYTQLMPSSTYPVRAGSCGSWSTARWSTRRGRSPARGGRRRPAGPPGRAR